ncbi:hypothetical protein F4804DRAFT_296385 [Jackrogersella minutella]|nr:hypothetical protein F4804DRAFT_296385 [Jackrogersella minutella]
MPMVEAMSDVESDDGKRSSKKRKASRACDRCNSQHQPCDNAAPKCSVCVRAGTECTYNRPVRKRGPRSGYTGQNGERLWAIVLQARPELEDIVLQVLRGGTYGGTGVPNLDYYRNNDNQAELVNWFNESRLGRFLQNGETPDLLLPPVNQHVSPIISQLRNEMGFAQPTNPQRQNDLTKSVSTRSNRSASMSQACPVNPHGAPQDPGDIYISSEDIRKRVFQPGQNQLNSYNLGFPEDGPQDFSVDRTPSILTAAQNSTPFRSNGSADGYGAGSQHTNVLDRRMSIDPSVHISEHSRQPELNNTPTTTTLENNELHLDETSRWLDSTPFDTLRNLGFAPGERMAEDFLELCENPDPVDHTPATSADQDEDEEAVWRRLVMRGRFI